MIHIAFWPRPILTPPLHPKKERYDIPTGEAFLQAGEEKRRNATQKAFWKPV